MRADLGEKPAGKVDLILDGGACPVGIESTIVDLSTGSPQLLRPGTVTREQLQAALGAAVPDAGRDAPRASGRLDSHYAPRTPLELVDEGALPRASTRCAPSGSRCSRRHARCSIAARRSSRARSRRPTPPNMRVACTRCCMNSTPQVRHASSSRGRHRAMPGMRCTIA